MTLTRAQLRPSDAVPAAPAGPPVTRARAGRAVRTGGLVLLAAVPLLVLAVLFFYPVGTMIGRGLGDAGAGLDILARPRFRRIALFTVGQAAASAALCVLLGLPVAHLVYRCRFPGRAAVRALLTVPFVLPTVVVALAFRTLLAQDGLLGSWRLDGSVAAVLAAHVCLNTAVVVRTVGVSWARLDRRPGDAARSLGASPSRVFLTVTLPALAPAVAAAFTLVFLFCATSFGIVLILGGARYGTLETEIYRQTEDLLDLPAAAVLSVVQILLVAAVLGVAALLRRRTERTLTAAPARPTGLRGRDLPAVLVTLVALAVTVGPLVVLAVRSLRGPGGWTLANYRALGTLGSDVQLVPVTTALGYSLRAAVVATAVALLLGVPLAVVLARRPRGRWARRWIGLLDGVAMLPLGVSAVTVGFGFLVALDRPPLDLRSSALLVPLAQALVATPLVVRMLLPVLRAVDDRLRQAAGLLGAGPLAVWWGVDLPLLARPLAGAAAFAFAVSLGEFGATSFLARPQTPTVPVLIARLISRPGAQNTATALAAATVLGLLCLAVVAAVDGLLDARSTDRPGAVGGF
ncbi:ABC transporter permease [Nakamurella endophytica]|uniref:Iron ABC transporter permease n=1 Tax=Nakamurella endophytica TaxID=1748367 RepID=A0A917W9Q5_9ACTN|nr:iron ABC transporter permease [Nakamurella endophytica]GGL86529.1 iron ABC transporter permease [Nakamurella endophytica]